MMAQASAAADCWGRDLPLALPFPGTTLLEGRSADHANHFGRPASRHTITEANSSATRHDYPESGQEDRQTKGSTKETAILQTQRSEARAS